MSKINVLLLCGGGGMEHEISLISATHINKSLADKPNIKVFQVEICKDGYRRDADGSICEMRKSGELFYPEKEETYPMHFAIPCIHGPPGETGEIQGIFEQMQLPYLGSGPEPSMNCFNKVTTKLYFDSLEIPNTPYSYLWNVDQIEDAKSTLQEWDSVFIKASNQGSSVGCYKASNEQQLEEYIKKAFSYGPYVLLEKALKARELEISAYEMNGELKVTHPGEIICPDGFYTYEEKYDSESHTTTINKAVDLTDQEVTTMQELAYKAFRALKLKDLARVDFFLTQDGEVFINEINTFPGMTPISMFPKMMEENGDHFSDFLMEKIESRARKE